MLSIEFSDKMNGDRALLEKAEKYFNNLSDKNKKVMYVATNDAKLKKKLKEKKVKIISNLGKKFVVLN